MAGEYQLDTGLTDADKVVVGASAVVGVGAILLISYILLSDRKKNK